MLYGNFLKRTAELGNAANRNELGMVNLKAELWSWYRAEENRDRRHTRIQVLTFKMLGASDNRCLHLHGAETNGFLYFTKDLLSRRGSCLGARGPHYQIAVDALVQILDIIRAHPVRVPPADIQRFCDSAIDHVRCLTRLCLPFKPKHHMLLEMGARFAQQKLCVCVEFGFHSVRMEAMILCSNVCLVSAG